MFVVGNDMIGLSYHAFGVKANMTFLLYLSYGATIDMIVYD